jgi:hypothetical protein
LFVIFRADGLIAPPLYITFLRNPLDLTLSLFRFLRQNAHQLAPEQLTTLPPNITACSLKEIAKHHVEHWFDENGQFSMQTAFFSPNEGVQIGCRLAGSGFYGRDDLAFAKECLSRFFFVGLVERMEESLLLLTRRLREFGIVLNPSLLPKDNTTVRVPADEYWVSNDDVVGRAILTCNHSDELLYAHFANCLEDELRALVKS